jgi:hypothetical protein
MLPNLNTKGMIPAERSGVTEEMDAVKRGRIIRAQGQRQMSKLVRRFQSSTQYMTLSDGSCGFGDFRPKSRNALRLHRPYDLLINIVYRSIKISAAYNGDQGSKAHLCRISVSTL